MKFQPLQYVFKSVGNPAAPTLLLLHGTGGNEHELLPLAIDFGKHLNVLSFRGNTLENGMPRFFKRLGDGVFDEMDLEFRVDEMIDFLKILAVKEDFDISNIIALGYSNGANIAGALLVLYPDFLAGAILYRPMQPFSFIQSLKSKGHIPLFMSSGRDDSTIETADINAFVGLLKDAGFNVTYYNIDAGHNLSRKDVDLSIAWFGKHF